MKKILYFLLVQFLIFPVGAQSTPSATEMEGCYKFGSMETWVLKADHRYTLTYYGGRQRGMWDIKDSVIQFTPVYEHENFVLYGWRDADLGDSIRFHFYGKGAKDSFIGAGYSLGDTKKMRKISEGTFLINADSISLKMRLRGRYGRYNGFANVYTFYNAQKFNDFFIFLIDDRTQEDLQPFSRMYKKGTIYNDDFSAEKSDIKEEDGFQEIIEIPIKDWQTPFGKELFFNPGFRFFDKKYVVEYLRYDKTKNAYLSLNYRENDEKSDDYNNQNIVYKFERMDSWKKIKIPDGLNKSNK